MAAVNSMTAEQVIAWLRSDDSADMVRESLRWLVSELMEAEASELIGARRGERTEDRATYRNGYRRGAGTPGPGRSSCNPQDPPGQLLPQLPRTAAPL